MNKIKNYGKTPINTPTIYSGEVPAKISAGLSDLHRPARIFATICNISETAIDSWMGFVFLGMVGRFYVGLFSVNILNKKSISL